MSRGVRRLGLVLAAAASGLGLVAGGEALACSPPPYQTPEEAEAADRTYQAQLWARAETVFVATVTDAEATPPAAPGAVGSVWIRLSPSLVIKGQGEPPASFDLSMIVGCVPDELAMARVGQAFVFYRNAATTTATVGASGGYVAADRLRDPATREAWEAAARR